MKPKRKRKVYYAFDSHDSASSAYPVIRIAGKFLEVFGFRIGEQIWIEYEPEKITITKGGDPIGRITKE